MFIAKLSSTALILVMLSSCAFVPKASVRTYGNYLYIKKPEQIRTEQEDPEAYGRIEFLDSAKVIAQKLV